MMTNREAFDLCTEQQSEMALKKEPAEALALGRWLVEMYGESDDTASN